MFLLDTNAALAILNRRDPNHEAMKAFFGQPILVPTTILPEVDYLATKYIGSHAARAFLAGLVAGEMTVLTFEASDSERCLAVMNRYPDVPLGFVDASIITLAERHRIQRILTFDRRHFSLVRPLNMNHFELLP